MYSNMVPGLRAEMRRRQISKLIDVGHHGWQRRKFLNFEGFESAILGPISSPFETNLWKNN